MWQSEHLCSRPTSNGMNKARVEALSDGVFAIAMTLLVIEVHVPHIQDGGYSWIAMWNALSSLMPMIASYVISFTVLAMYWTSHHAMFHFFTKNVNRAMLQMNMLYLMFLAFIPFSTELLGTYPTNIVAVWVYAVNIILMGSTAFVMFLYAQRSKEIEMHDLEHRTMTQAKIRILLTPSFALLAMIVAFVSIPLAFILFIFPVIFNLIPGTLNATEKFLGITIR